MAAIKSPLDDRAAPQHRTLDYVMARRESDREDLLREATALVPRVELKIAEFNEHVVVGFRRNGAGSLFFGPDPVFQFNSQGELRRAFWDGRLLKADKGNLASLTRARTDEEVQLQRRDLDAEETKRFVQLVRQHLDALQAALEGNQYTIIGQVPEDTDIVERIRTWLESLSGEIVVAGRPNVR